MTLNIWHREAPWEARRELIRREVAALSPDILGLQEVLELAQPHFNRSQAQEILRDLPYGYVFGRAQTIGAGLDFGNAIASRYPIVEHEVVSLPGAESGETRSVIFARVDTPLGQVPVFVTHLNWKLHHGAIRMRQVQALVALVDQRAPPGETAFPAVLMGDLNAEPESDEIRFLRGFATREGQSTFFADAWVYGGDGGPGFTFDRNRNAFAARAHEPPRRIDYILVRGPDEKLRGEPLLTKLVCDTPESGVWPSDHFGVYSELSAGK